MTGRRGTGAALAISGGALYAAAFPPVDAGALAWVALVPLYFAVRNEAPRRAALLGALFAIIAKVATFSWIFRFEQFRAHHALFLGAWLALPCALLAVVLCRFARDARALFFVPASAVFLDWMQGHAGFLAFPWGSFGQTQHQNLPLLQLASLGGEPLLTFAVVAGNIAVATLVARAPFRRAVLGVIAGIALCHGLGAAMLTATEAGERVTLAAVQPAIMPGEREADHTDQIFERLARLTREVATRRPALIVWPETAVRDPERDLMTKLQIRALVEETQTPILFGASESGKLAAPSDVRAKSYNSAYLMEPGKSVGAPYRKVHLLPFGEYQPLAVKWPGWLVPTMFLTESGDARRALAMGEAEEGRTLRIEPMICWENLFADDVRAIATAEPSVIAHLVNDAWFGPTSEPRLHDLVSAIRAVENRRPIVVASNTGPSEIIDARGVVVARSTAFFQPATVTATLTIPGGMSPYRRAGDLTWLVPMLAIGALLARLGPPARA